MAELTSSATFTIADRSGELASLDTTVFPPVSYPTGKGRIVHPVLGAFDYEIPPDQTVNLDGDVVIAPTWAGTKTLGGAAHSLWQGSIKDVVCEERWTAESGLAMPIAQFRMLKAIWMAPVDPKTGYVIWFPNYDTDLAYKVIPVDLVGGSAGSTAVARLSGVGAQAITLDDVKNHPLGGWVTTPVTLFLQIVDRYDG